MSHDPVLFCDQAIANPAMEASDLRDLVTPLSSAERHELLEVALDRALKAVTMRTVPVAQRQRTLLVLGVILNRVVYVDMIDPSSPDRKI
jgi:hypothetical protein